MQCSAVTSLVQCSVAQRITITRSVQCIAVQCVALLSSFMSEGSFGMDNNVSEQSETEYRVLTADMYIVMDHKYWMDHDWTNTG